MRRVADQGGDGRNILVFCASSESCEPKYHACASRLGEVLGRAGDTVIYGGGAQGSMGALATAALRAGGRVVGIQPRFMNELEWTHAHIQELVLVEDMQERMRRMLDSADAIVALPGGSGTLEELFNAITAKRLGALVAPVVIVNQDGFYDPLIAQLSACVEHRFMDERHRAIWQVVTTADEVPAAIEAAPEWSRDAIQFATL